MEFFGTDTKLIEQIAIVVGLVRDILLLVLLAVALIALVVVFSKISQLLNTVKDTAESVQEAVNTISEKVVEPTASNAGVMRGIGGFFGFILGMGRRRKQEK